MFATKKNCRKITHISDDFKQLKIKYFPDLFSRFMIYFHCKKKYLNPLMVYAVCVIMKI